MKKTYVSYPLILLIVTTIASSLDTQNKFGQISDKNQEIVFNLAYDPSSIEKIFASPEKVIENVSAFWETEDAYRLIKSWHRYNNIPIDYEGWEKNIDKIAIISPDQRRTYPIYELARNIIGAKELFARKAIPYISSFLPKKNFTINVTAYFAAFTYSRGIGVGDRIVIDIVNPYYHGNLSMILNAIVHELYHIGFGCVQLARTDPEFDNSAISRMIGDLQNEGIATYVGYKAQGCFPAPYEEDYSMLESKKTVLKLLKRLNALFKEAESVPTGLLQKKSWDLGVEKRAFYVVGAHVAQVIDEKRGREALNATVMNGPITFIRTYNALVDKNWWIHEPNIPVDQSIFERLRQTAVNQDYDKYGELFTKLKEKICKIDRTEEEKLLRIGLVFMQRKRNDLAIDIFRWSAKLFPGSAAAYNLLGIAYLQNGDDKSALENFQISVGIDPENVDAIMNLKNLLGN